MDFKVNGFSFSSIRTMLAISLSYITLLCWGMFLLYLVYPGILLWRVLDFVKGFFCINWDDLVIFLSLIPCMCCITSVDLYMLNNAYTPEMKPTWSWCIIFLMCWWIQFSGLLLGIFITMLIKETGLWFSFFVCPYLVLVPREYSLHRMSLVAFFSFLIYGIISGAMVLVLS
jgi:hypothetical protein